MTSVALRHGLTVEDPLGTALSFLERYGGAERDRSPATFSAVDLRRANGGGARISAAEQAAILRRRDAIERALGALPPRASLLSSRPPWHALTELFAAFGGISGVGFSKMTKALHPKRPALIPILDSVVCGYLGGRDSSKPFGAEATAFVRRYKLELDRNRDALAHVRRELARHRYLLTEVRLLDVLIWSASQPT